MIKRIIAGLAIAAAGGVGALTLAATPAAATATADCRTVISHIADRPDSAASGGNWAKDTFTRTLKICAEAAEVPADAKAAAPVAPPLWKYTAEAVDSGTFVTDGVKSFTGATMKPGVHGTFTGGFKATLTGPASFAGLKADADTNVNTKSSSEWLPFVFPGSKAELTTWGWTYTTCNEKLVNASAGNSGDITGLSKALGGCLVVSFEDGCTTLKVTVKNAAPDVVTKAVFAVVGHTGPITVVGGETKTVVVEHPSKDHDVVVGVGGEKNPVRHRWTPKGCPTSGPTGTPTNGPTSPSSPTASPSRSNSPSPGIPGTSTSGGAAGGNGSLPVTGSPVAYVAGSGVALVAAGAGILFVMWRRRRDTVTFEA